MSCLEGFITDITGQHEAQRVQDAVMQVASTITPRLGDDYLPADPHSGMRFWTWMPVALMDSPPTAKSGVFQRRDTGMSLVSAVVDDSRSRPTLPLPSTPCERVFDEQEAMALESRQYQSARQRPSSSLLVDRPGAAWTTPVATPSA
ncbi:hypothetical protein DSL92_07835 [Billgrantia gudaonensis]|uniref:Uncharacterized protein n=1 Tax=Billgrantia gudaonensis TaxID=376427 RepID=A0A3S0NEE4_9GAMM|nr:hypothetical protein DSL92_07835 [Halomonas gudaonensis]